MAKVRSKTKKSDTDKTKTYAVIRQDWLESERGWGQRPDGYSLHASDEDRKEYIEDYWAKQPKDEVPDEYTRPDGSPKTIRITETIFNQIKKSKNGIRFYR